MFCFTLSQDATGKWKKKMPLKLGVSKVLQSQTLQKAVHKIYMWTEQCEIDTKRKNIYQ